MEVRVEKEIAAPPAAVFERAADLENAPARVRGIERLEILTEGPIGVGTRFRETRILFKREATETMEITEFDPPRGYAVVAESHGCKYYTRFDFVPSGPSGTGTRVQVLFRAEPQTRGAKVMGFLMRPMMKSCAKLFLKDLEDIEASLVGAPATGS